MTQYQVIQSLKEIVGRKKVMTDPTKTAYYRTGFRSGKGEALAVVFPQTLVELWKVAEACVKADCIVILQAAKTGLTEGSAPSGSDYDRDVVIVNTLAINDIHLINNGEQAISLAGATLHSLEEKLNKINRDPHSVIGSSQIGASVIGGIANNSGGALCKRAPAYTELALYAQVNENGELELINHLGIDGLGDTPEEILTNVEKGNFSPSHIQQDTGMASDTEYAEWIRDITSDIPARFNADERRLFEASGSAGKLLVFAVRTDTFEKPKKEQVFYLGTNNPEKLAEMRKDVLTQFKELPDMAEYLHRDIFKITEKYGKDTFLAIKYMGTSKMPMFFAMKAWAENVLKRIPFLSNSLPDKTLQLMSRLFPQHLPQRMLDYRDKYEYHLILCTSDDGIQEAADYLKANWTNQPDSDYFTCTEEEGEKALLHRFAAGGAAGRYALMHKDTVEGILPLDVAMRRNDFDWVEKLPKEITDKLYGTMHYGHFMCNVFHQNYLVKKGEDRAELKKLMLKFMEAKGAKLPAEHNFGHQYEADDNVKAFYKKLDPTNTFNPGVGKMSKLKNHQ